MTVEWVDRRADVLAALDALGKLPGAGYDVTRPPEPTLTDAVHWLVDDTWWDVRDLRQSIGTLLADVEEAEAVEAVVRELVAVSERQGPGAPDRLWFDDIEWPRIRAAAKRAADVMRRNSR